MLALGSLRATSLSVVELDFAESREARRLAVAKCFACIEATNLLLGPSRRHGHSGVDIKRALHGVVLSYFRVFEKQPISEGLSSRR